MGFVKFIFIQIFSGTSLLTNVYVIREYGLKKEGYSNMLQKPVARKWQEILLHMDYIP